MKTILVFYALATCAAFPQSDEWQQWMERGHAQMFDFDYSAAISSYQHAVHIAERIAPRGSQLVDALNGLANGHAQMGRLVEAEREYRRALSIVESSYKETSAHAFVLANLGSVQLERGRYAQSEALLREAITIGTRTLAPDSGQLALARIMLSRVRMRGPDYAEADELLMKAISTVQANPQIRLELLAIAFDDLGALRRLQGRHAEAAEAYARSIAVFERASGPDHPGLLRALNDLAVTSAGLGRTAEAAANFRRAVSILERRLKPDSPIAGPIYRNYAAFLRQTGDKAQAKVFESRAASIRAVLPVDVSLLEER